MTREGEPAMPPSTWRYRVVRQTHDDETLYGIHEAYDGGTSWTARPVAPVAETVAELRDVLAKMATAPDQPVITDATPTAVDVPMNVPPVRCPYCRDEFGPDELVDGDVAEVVCTMCAKAGRTATPASPQLVPLLRECRDLIVSVHYGDLDAAAAGPYAEGLRHRVDRALDTVADQAAANGTP